MMKQDPRTDFFDRIAGQWDGWHDLGALGARLDATLDRWGVGAAERVVDVGCGTGNVTLALLRRLGAEGRVVAVDISEGMLAAARAKCSDARAEWVLAEAGTLPLAAESCDRVICFSAWPHFTDGAAVAREFARVLRPGGTAHILHFISRAKVNAIHAEGDASVKADVLLPVEEVAPLFAAAGFTVTETRDDDEMYALTAVKGV